MFDNSSIITLHTQRWNTILILRVSAFFIYNFNEIESMRFSYFRNYSSFYWADNALSLFRSHNNRRTAPRKPKHWLAKIFCRVEKSCFLIMSQAAVSTENAVPPTQSVKQRALEDYKRKVSRLKGSFYLHMSSESLGRTFDRMNLTTLRNVFFCQHFEV